MSSISEQAGSCPLCDTATSIYLFVRHGSPVLRCSGCGLVRQIAGAAAAGSSADTRSVSSADRRAAQYIDALERRGASRDGLLAVAPDGHPFLGAASGRGLTVSKRVRIGDVESDLAQESFSAAVVLYELERASDPVAALRRLHRALTPDALILLATPSLDSLPARLLRGQWPEWLPDSRFYFTAQTIQSALLRAGFAEIEWAADTRGSSALLVTARRIQPAPRPVLSVVMPVFNERATFDRTFQTVLHKDLPGVDKEIVIVESRSTDGTRELVQRIEGTPCVKVIYEDRPRGKGAAVRAGLKAATGTVVLIQDADDEYDVDDYDALLEPVVMFRRAFVLGSRHLGSWKVRKFANQPGVSAFFNSGHVIFRSLLNLMYGQNLNDPFTMYKVFRRDCLHGLKFECNRFDFDFELVIKLLRKGYVPLEIPVNYRSRSFAEGKKVSAVRDPITWIRALVKYRFAEIYERSEGRGQRAEGS